MRITADAVVMWDEPVESRSPVLVLLVGAGGFDEPAVVVEVVEQAGAVLVERRDQCAVAWFEAPGAIWTPRRRPR